MECRISGEFLLRNLNLFAHATNFTGKNKSVCDAQFDHNFKQTFFVKLWFLLVRVLVFFSKHVFLNKPDDYLFPPKRFLSRVGWEGFALFLTEIFRLSLPSFFFPPSKQFPIWS